LSRTRSCCRSRLIRKEQEGKLTYLANVHFKYTGGSEFQAIGEKPLHIRPVSGASVPFEHLGRTLTGTIDRVEPDTWETLGVTPNVYIVVPATA
jgi:hypothetical protein